MTDLNRIYTDELQDLWSANVQMQEVVDDMSEAVEDEKLSKRFKESADGIRIHADMLESLVQDAGAEKREARCKGMEGLVAEARRHALDDDSLDGQARDLAAIAHYQRMCHYGIAGFGTAKAYAEALGKADHAEKLDGALKRIYASDEYMTELAERSRMLNAA